MPGRRIRSGDSVGGTGVLGLTGNARLGGRGSIELMRMYSFERLPIFNRMCLRMSIARALTQL